MSSVPRLTMDLNRVFLKRLSDSIFPKLLLVMETNSEKKKLSFERKQWLFSRNNKNILMSRFLAPLLPIFAFNDTVVLSNSSEMYLNLFKI
jgi:hypothetical protein